MTAGRKVVGHAKDWGTPKKYVDAVKECFGGTIDLDPCSNRDSIVDARVEYRLPEKDGLRDTWNFPTVYVNPPYGIDRQHGRTIKEWIKRCEEAHRVYGSEVLALVPVATNTGHWKRYVYGWATGICFLYDTRLRFLVCGKDEGKGAPMSCAMIYWGQNFRRFSEVFMRFGAVVNIENLKGIKIGEANQNENGQMELAVSG
ncbi:MAG: DNA N-6-adenine-methyltransferase [Terriglobia bacterium]